MEIQEIIKTLRNFRKKWRREITRERKFQDAMIKQHPHGCSSLEKSVGIDIGYNYCTSDIDKLIKKLEAEQRRVVTDLETLIKNLKNESFEAVRSKG